MQKFNNETFAVKRCFRGAPTLVGSSSILGGRILYKCAEHGLCPVFTSKKDYDDIKRLSEELTKINGTRVAPVPWGWTLFVAVCSFWLGSWCCP